MNENTETNSANNGLWLGQPKADVVVAGVIALAGATVVVGIGMLGRWNNNRMLADHRPSMAGFFETMKSVDPKFEI